MKILKTLNYKSIYNQKRFTSILNKHKNKATDVNSMHSKVSKFITPNKDQKYFDEKIVDKHFDRQRYNNERSAKLGPTKPIYEDSNLFNVYNVDQDRINEIEKKLKKGKIVTYNDYFESFDKNEFSRLRQQIHFATEVNNNYSPNELDLSKLHSASNYLKSETSESQDGIYKNAILDAINIHKNQTGETNFSKETRSASDYLTIEEEFDNIVKKLEYLDYREFLALNRYIIEDEVHQSLIDKTKKNLVLVALDILDKKKREEVKAIFQKIDFDDTVKKESGVKIDANEETTSQKKFNYLMNNIKGSSELFYKYYYVLKKQMKEEDYKHLSQFDKIEELKNMKEKEQKSIYDFEISELGEKDDKLMNNKKFGFDTEIDNLIKIYRKKRLRSTTTKVESIIKKVSEVFQFKDIPQTMKDLKKAMEIQQKEEEKIKLEQEKEIEKQKAIAAKEAEEKKNAKAPKGGNKGVVETSVLPPGVNLEMLRPRRSRQAKSDSDNPVGYEKPKKDKYISEHKKTNFREDEDEDEEIEDEEIAIKKFFETEEYLKCKHKEEILLYIKYLIINDKLGTGYIYEPSNIETEKKIYNYLRSRIERKPTSLNELTKNDSFLKMLSQNNLINLDLMNVNEKDSIVLTYMKSLQSNTDVSFNSSFDTIKENYIKSKTNYEKESLLEEFDREYAKQFGYSHSEHIWELKNNTNFKDTIKVNNKVFPAKININTPQDFIYNEPLIRSIVNNYYKEYKIDFMYNYMDFFSNKYQVRRKLMETSANRLSLSEFNHLLTKFAYNVAAKQENKDKLDFTNQIKLNINNGKVNKIENIFNILEQNQKRSEDMPLDKFYNNNNTFSPKIPFEMEEKFKKFPHIFDNKDKNKIISAMMSTTTEFHPSRYDSFEVEMYKQVKRDPYYKHHMLNFLAFQTDKANNFAEFATISNKFNKSISKSYIADNSHIHNSAMLTNFMKDYSEEEMVKYYDVSRKIKEISLNKNIPDTNESIALVNNDYENMINGLESSIDETKNKNISKINIFKTQLNDVFRGMNDFKFTGTGKRKTSVASATLSPGTGKIIINGKPFHLYFSCGFERYKVLTPLRVTNLFAQVNLDIFVYGGGLTGQSEAIIPAISKSIIKLNRVFEKELLENMAIRHDPRNVERKKRGLQKARKGQVYNRR